MSTFQPIPKELADPIERLGADAAVGERRDGIRRDTGFWAGLVTLDGCEVLRSKADNICEGGLHLTAPVGFGFAVGQRYEVLVGQGEDCREQANLLGEGHYATIVRTEFVMNDDGDRVGIGLRFDQPVIL
ncbi:MAG TPA: hypothetical protein VM243_20555 [Phycisphaerae bacterium]|nr:hypothetical protein [Phycisphaerae bacterium]